MLACSLSALLAYTAATAAASYPMAMSGDGRWLFRTDARNILQRSAAGGATTDASMALPVAAATLSASDDGHTIAIYSRQAPACIAIATFRTGGNANISWLRLDGAPLAKGGPLSACAAPAAVVTVTKTGGTANAAAGAGIGAGANTGGADATLALSADGSQIALGGDQVRVIELAHMRTVLTVPSGGDAVLDVRFADQGRKLVVAQSHHAGADSELRFAVWDIARRELFNFQRNASPGYLRPADLVWQFSEASGELWMLNTSGRIGTTPSRAKGGKTAARSPQQSGAQSGAQMGAPAPFAINLKQCSVRTRTGAPLRAGADNWYAFAADPRGRWLASIAPETDDAGHRTRSRLTVQDSRSGRVITERVLDGELRGLTPSANGTMLYGTLQAGGGQLLAFDLAADLGAVAPQPDAPWSSKRCAIEDEAPQARDIASDLQPPDEAFRRMLPDDAPEIDGRPCHGDEWWNASAGAFRPKAWGATSTGTIWLDRVNQLEKVDLESGASAGRITTPRTEKVCSLPLYDRQQFLVWDGDAVALQPFTSKGGQRKVLVSKPGWFAESVVPLGDRIGVRWVRSRTAAAPIPVSAVAPPPPAAAPVAAAGAPGAPGAAPAAAAPAASPPIATPAAGAIPGTGGDTAPPPVVAAATGAPSAASPIRQGGMGSALAIVYSAEGKALRQVAGRVDDGRPVFAGGQDTALFRTEGAAHEAYHWQSGYFDSVRAQRNGMGTILWVGLEAQAGNGEPRKPGKVVSLGGAMGALLEDDSVSVYDASQRRRVARVPLGHATSATWVPARKLLVLEAPSDENAARTGLYAFELE